MRLGGDEFGVFAIAIIDRDMVEAITRRLFYQIDHFDTEGLNGEKVSISVGAAFYGGEKNGQSFEELYASADHAMYESKKLSGNSLTFGV